MPKLTVLMTVYNGEAFLRETVESILSQTYKDFKFLIIDNASVDKSREIIRSFDDPRIRLVALPENIGQIPALNKGLDMIDTLFIARIDADDISMPRRFARQMAFMENHPEVGVCGTYFISFKGKKEMRWQLPCSSEDINVRLLFECIIAHPSVMIRKSLFDQHRLRYDETIGHSEDWQLWQRAGRYFQLANIPEYLLRYRIHESNVTFKIFHRQDEAAEKLDSETLKLLGLENHALRPIHRDVALITFNAKNRDARFIQEVQQWFAQLQKANRTRRIYSQEALDRLLKERLFIVITNNIRLRGQVLKIFIREKLYRHVKWLWSFKFMVKIFLSYFRIYIGGNEGTVY